MSEVAEPDVLRGGVLQAKDVPVQVTDMVKNLSRQFPLQQALDDEPSSE